MWWFIFFFFLSIIVAVIITYIKNIKVIYIRNDYKNNIIYNKYDKKCFMTSTEMYFYNIMRELENKYHLRVHPQVNLSSVIDKISNNKYRNELFRNIDFGIFTDDYSKLLLLIEINDSSHNSRERQLRDIKVQEIVNIANIKLIRFNTKYSNKKYYVQNRILEELGIKKDD